MRLEDLNDSQKRAVKYTDGALLIIAGAGSGKTRVLTNRIAYLIEECGVDPYNIMAITFTNKAAREMKERVETTVAQGAGADAHEVKYFAYRFDIAAEMLKNAGFNYYTIFNERKPEFIRL